MKWLHHSRESWQADRPREVWDKAGICSSRSTQNSVLPSACNVPLCLFSIKQAVCRQSACSCWQCGFRNDTGKKKKKKKQLTCVTAVGSRSIAAISFKAHLTHTSCLNQTKNITQKYKIPTDAQIEETTSCCCSFSLSAHVWETSLSAQRCFWCQQLQADAALVFLLNVILQPWHEC